MSQAIVSDLGVAAYVLMHDYKLLGRQNKMIYFEADQDEIDDLKAEYLSSEFHRFDHCIMALKKHDESSRDLAGYRFVTDLGAAAFLLMHKFKMVGRKGKAFYFEVNGQEEAKQFDELNLEYVTSEFNDFDSKLMAVKKMGEFMK